MGGMTGWRQAIQRQTRAAAEQVVVPLARWGVTPNQLTVAGLLLNARGQALVDAVYRSLGHTSDNGGVWTT